MKAWVTGERFEEGGREGGREGRTKATDTCCLYFLSVLSNLQREEGVSDEHARSNSQGRCENAQQGPVDEHFP